MIDLSRVRIEKSGVRGNRPLTPSEKLLLVLVAASDLCRRGGGRLEFHDHDDVVHSAIRRLPDRLGFLYGEGGPEEYSPELNVALRSLCASALMCRPDFERPELFEVTAIGRCYLEELQPLLGDFEPEKLAEQFLRLLKEVSAGE